MKESTLLLAALAASSYAAPSPSIPNALSKRLDVKSFALPEECYFDGEQPSEAAVTPIPKLSFKATASGSGGDSPRWEYAPPYRGGQIPILAKWSHFHALGDSFSAGPGAGEYYGEDGGQFGDDWCYRTKGSYAVQLITNNEHRDFFDLGPEEEFQFLSCTGHITQNVVDYQVPQLSFGAADTHMTVSLSIGGNDLGFAHVLKQCLLNRADLLGFSCNSAKNTARNLITNKDGKNTFRDNLYKVWNNLKDPKTGQFPIVAHTLYPTFFNAEFANCNDVRILKFGNKLSMKIRQEFNELVKMANEVIIKHLLEFQRVNPFAQGRFFPIEVDEMYDGHRLCEPFVEDLPGFSNDDVWFFGVASSDSDGDEDDAALVSRGLAARSNAPLLDEIDPETCDPYHKDMGHAWGCMMVQQNQTSEEDTLVHLDKRLPQFITKSFHPKTAGFTATVEAIKLQLPRDAGRTGGRKRSISGTPASPSVKRQDNPEGWDETFNGELSDDVFIPEVSYPINVAVSGMVPCTNQLETIMGTLGEAHFVDIDEANVVLMYDGVAEILEASDDEGAFDAWKALYDDLAEKVGDNTVILASSVLPPPGLDDGLKQRFAEVNDRIIEHLQSVSMDQRTIAVDLSQFVAGPDKSDADVSVEGLKDETYVAMLHAWLNGVSHAAINLDWIDKYTTADPNPEPEPAPPTPSPPTEDPDKKECEANQVFGDCEEAKLEDTEFGPRAPVCRKAIGDNPTSKLISEEKARESASIYCKNLVDDKVVLTKDDTTVSPGSSDGAIDGGKINLTVLFDSKSCAEGAEQKVDFGEMGLDKCFENLYTTLQFSCGMDPAFGDYNEDYPMLGGTWGSDCALWDITGS